MARCLSVSAKNCSRVMPSVRSSAFRACFTISRSQALSGDMDPPLVRQDVRAAVRIRIRIVQIGTLNNVDIPTDDPRQLFLHVAHLPKPPADALVESHKKIHVAVLAKVVTQDGAEHFYLRDLPSLAKRL